MFGPTYHFEAAICICKCPWLNINMRSQINLKSEFTMPQIEGIYCVIKTWYNSIFLIFLNFQFFPINKYCVLVVHFILKKGRREKEPQVFSSSKNWYHFQKQSQTIIRLMKQLETIVISLAKIWLGTTMNVNRYLGEGLSLVGLFVFRTATVPTLTLFHNIHLKRGGQLP